MAPAALLLLALAPATADDPTVRGRAVFADSVRWMQGTGPAMQAVTSAHLLFKDVQIDDEASSGRHHQGHLELWFQAPNRFREEWRTSSRDTSPTIKVLDGGKAWIKTPSSKTWKAQHGRGDGAATIRQLKRDLKQLADLARFLSPVSLDGKGVTWTLEGAQRLAAPLAPKDAPAFERVRRTAPGEPTMVFFFAKAPAAAGQAAGRHPHAVGIQGDKASGQRQEWFVLDRWRRMPNGHARPARIQGFAPATTGGLRRFVLLFPERVQLNPKLADTVFGPPK
ncbi:MAG: hypothetical protein QNJ98_03795 [Planctomycetota bacterium]|nr:hypothetical protein [Planctomycetota bacterium]